MTRRCITVLGGSFDPVHNGHVALADYFTKLLTPDELRIIPAGNPWQKETLQATAEQRLAMAQLAFGRLAAPVHVDPQEIHRTGPSYSIDTLRALRAELGPDVSLALLIGADQLQHLHTWKDWRQLFEHAHICAASRPGFSIDAIHLAPEVAREFSRRAGTVEQIRATPYGLTYLATNLAIEVSSTQIRTAFKQGIPADSLIPARVLDYIKHHHLYT